MPKITNKATINAIARVLSYSLLINLGKSKMKKIAKKNTTVYKGTGMCATHDFCDPNEYFLDAFFLVLGTEFNLQNQKHCAIYNNVFSTARKNNFDYTTIK